MTFRGVPRIFEKGLPLVVDPRCGGVGAQPPAAEELLIFKLWFLLNFITSYVAEHYTYLFMRIVQYINKCINIAILSSIESILN